MAIIGTILKKGIALNQLIAGKSQEPKEAQELELRKLLQEAQHTAFGKFHGFSELLAAENLIQAFQAEVPIVNYQQMHDRWWHKQQKFPDITWPGKPSFFALSSGTTGKASKRIPITDAFLKSMKDVGASLIKELPAFDFPEELYESEILMLSSSANLSKHEYGHKEGEISGINVSNFPEWYDLFYRPGKDIAAIADWDERVTEIAIQAKNWNIGAIAGIPSWVLLMLQRVIEFHQVDTIHDIWPNFSVYASGGVAFETYRKDFEHICGKPITIMDTYLASEGFFSYSSKPDKMDMKLALEHGYFYEFVPFDERGVDETGALLENPEILTVDQVELDQDYVLIISTCAGAWRYQIGDTIKFSNLETPEILITGRTKFFLNVVGSQLSEDKMDAGILEVSETLGTSVNEYSVAALQKKDGSYYHQWIVVCEEKVDTTEITKMLDQSLMDANKNYKVARNKSLKDIQVKIISKEAYHDFLAKNKKKGGQVKTPKVMTKEKMEDFLEFLA